MCQLSHIESSAMPCFAPLTMTTSRPNDLHFE
uniref:Uncharacterized protein n=1 Tax=Anguilla anguilla TaxID=7936 RepID=A0A0E9XDB3_ANGAN